MKTAFRRGVEGLVAAATAAALALSFASPAQADAAVDVQQTTVGSSSLSAVVMAQTFTADTTAQLVRVSLTYYTGFATVLIGIQHVDSSGKPNGTYLTKNVFSASQYCCRNWGDFTFTLPAAVTQGTQYAIVVTRQRSSFNWFYAINAGFTGGSAYTSICDAGCPWSLASSATSAFGFKTWVTAAPAANQAPTISADQRVFNVDEGTAPSNTGTYADGDGDAVTLTATSGTVNKTGTSSGTWSWTGPASDEGPAHSVTITADDGHGLTQVATFTYTPVGVAPTAQILTDPASIPEGKAESFTGGATVADPADNTGLTYKWTVTKDNAAFAQATGTSPAFAFTPDDEGSYQVSLVVVDDGGMTSVPQNMTMAGTDVTPVVGAITASSGLLANLPNEPVNFSSTFSDAGGMFDSHTATWTYGDGLSDASSYAAGTSGTAAGSHLYSKPGTYTVTLAVSDDDGTTGLATKTVTIQTTQQALSTIGAYVQSLPLNKGQKNSLQAKLDAASAATSRGDTTAAHNQLNAFLNELNAYVGAGKLTDAQAAPLRNTVLALQSTLGTYNRFLEWLSLVA